MAVVVLKRLTLGVCVCVCVIASSCLELASDIGFMLTVGKALTSY